MDQYVGCFPENDIVENCGDEESVFCAGCRVETKSGCSETLQSLMAAKTMCSKQCLLRPFDATSELRKTVLLEYSIRTLF